MIIKKGQLLTFAEGAYSDYCVEALVEVTKEFNLEEKQGEWENLHTEEEGLCEYKSRLVRRVRGTAFLPWLVSQGLVEDRDYTEIHTGSYGCSEINIFRGGVYE